MYCVVLQQKNHKLIIFIIFAVNIQKVFVCSVNTFFEKMKLSFAVFSLVQAGIRVGVKSYVGYENPYDLIILLQ